MKNGKHCVVGIGELLWDLLPEGKKLGGAPANFAYHANNAGCIGEIISAVGDDELGSQLLDSIKERGLGTGQIQIVSDCPTGTVSVSIDNKGIPSYQIHENVAWDNIRYTVSMEQMLESADAICFGSLAQRSELSAKTINKCLRNMGPACLKIFDINIRQDYYSPEIIRESLLLSDILKINEDEILIVAELFDMGSEEDTVLEKLMKEFSLKYIALTKGSDSSILYSGDEISEIRTPEVDVLDTVGAGDSFTAVLAAGLLRGEALRSVHQKAVELSAWVCTRQGATPSYDQNAENIIFRDN